jgi:hypothetical protein
MHRSQNPNSLSRSAEAPELLKLRLRLVEVKACILWVVVKSVRGFAGDSSWNNIFEDLHQS